MKKQHENTLKNVSPDVFAQKYNITLMFEIIDLYIETHLNLKQIYLLDFSLQDDSMKEILKPKAAEME